MCWRSCSSNWAWITNRQQTAGTAHKNSLEWQGATSSSERMRMGVITCHGCGKRLSIPAGYTRRKVQCPDCGVYCEVQPPAKKDAAPSPIKQAAKKTSPPKVDDDAIFAEAYRAPDPAPPRPAKPPADTKQAAPTPATPAPATDPLPKAPTLQFDPVPDEDDGRAYRFADADLPKCPGCRKELAADTQLCPHCGFNLETGKKAVKTYTEVNRVWEAGMPLARRRKLFILAEVLIVPLGLLGAVVTGYWEAFVWPWLWFTFLAAFLLGTFDRLELTRD